MATVFLSYRHENDAHRGRVRALGAQLRREGIEVVLDQFFLEAYPGGPNEGWPRWSKKQAAETEKVLIIGSPGWFRCYERKELPGTGLGASAEAVVIGQRLYKVAGVSGQIRVAVFDPADAATVPLDEGDRAEARRLVARGLERMEALAQVHPLTPYEQQVRAWLEALELVQN